MESPEESTKELTQEPETREAKKEKIQAKVAAQQEKLKAQLLKMLGTPTEEQIQSSLAPVRHASLLL